MTDDTGVSEPPEKRPSDDPELVEGDLSPPKAIRKAVAEFFAMTVRGGGPRYHPVFDKFEPEHVEKFLDLTHEDDQEERAIRRSNRWFHLAYVVLGFAGFGLLTVYLLPDQKDLYVEILRVALAFGAGVGSGYGLKARLDERRS